MLMPLLKSTITKWNIFTADFARRENFKHENFISSTIYLSFWSPVLKLCTHNKKEEWIQIRLQISTKWN